MRKTILNFLAISCLCFMIVGGGSHAHKYAPSDCTSPKVCTLCGNEKGEPLGHTTALGVCQRCGETQNEELVECLQNGFDKVISAGEDLISCVVKASELDGTKKEKALESAYEYARAMVDAYDEIIETCDGEEELERILFQVKLLASADPTAVIDKYDVSTDEQMTLYQFYMNQIASSCFFMAEDMDYIEGNGDKPSPIEYFGELHIPTPDSVVYGITYDSELNNGATQQYIYLLGDEQAEADANYNQYIRAAVQDNGYELSIENEYVYITDNDELITVLGAGKDQEKGYFMIVSFKE